MELKASDLRRFNILNCETGVNDNEYIPCVVTQILKDGVTVNANGREDYYIDLSAVQPIQLTEEWLLKFGFEKWGDEEVNEYEFFERYVLFNAVSGTSNFEVHVLHSNYGGIEEDEIIYSIDMDDRWNYIENTEYVHVLQNAFALTGQELTIKE